MLDHAIGIFILTGNTNQLTRAKLMNCGADEFLNKPVEFEDLVEQIRRFVPLEKRVR